VNRHGVRGTDYNQVSGEAKTGQAGSRAGNHGGIGPWTVRNTMLASGPDFKRAAVIRTPTSNVDVTPTLLYLLGNSQAVTGMDGRVMLEALAAGPDEEQVALDTRTLRVQNGPYRAVLQVSEAAGKRYIQGRLPGSLPARRPSSVYAPRSPAMRQTHRNRTLN
jgi:arylsulfatase A-like enzyme